MKCGYVDNVDMISDYNADNKLTFMLLRHLSNGDTIRLYLQ